MKRSRTVNDQGLGGSETFPKSRSRFKNERIAVKLLKKIHSKNQRHFPKIENFYPALLPVLKTVSSGNLKITTSYAFDRLQRPFRENSFGAIRIKQAFFCEKKYSSFTALNNFSRNEKLSKTD